LIPVQSSVAPSVAIIVINRCWLTTDEQNRFYLNID
jgi:hypothetical protein